MSRGATPGPPARTPRRGVRAPVGDPRGARPPGGGPGHARPPAGDDHDGRRGGRPPAGAARDAPLGGQAVVEGVMMRGVRHWAVAVRLPLPEQVSEGPLRDGEAARGRIAVHHAPFRSALARHRVLRLPVLRGFVALIGSLRLGFRALRIAAEARQPDGEPIAPREWGIAVVLGVALAVGLFVLTPVGLTSLIRDQLGSSWAFWMVEGLVSAAILVGYLALVSRLPDLRRVFEYHGAEHKTIACYEAGLELNPENAARFSRLHPRCGTSFLLVVMLVAVVVYSPLGLLDWWAMMLIRLVGVPVITGVSFEAIKLAGRHREVPLVRALTWPGMQLQRLTTREPDRDQLAVAIAALEAVLAHEDPHAATAADRAGIEVAA